MSNVHCARMSMYYLPNRYRSRVRRAVMRYNSCAYIGHIRNILNFQKNIGVEMQGSSGTRRFLSRRSFHPRSIVLPIIVLLTIAVLAVGIAPRYTNSRSVGTSLARTKDAPLPGYLRTSIRLRSPLGPTFAPIPTQLPTASTSRRLRSAG